MYDIPMELVVNFDHTPIHFIQLKGASWCTGEETEKGTKGKGDKRQFTGVVGTSPTETFPAQVVMEASTSAGMPQVAGQRMKGNKFVSAGKRKWKRKKQQGKVYKVAATEKEMKELDKSSGLQTTAGFVGKPL
eukprot:Lithocolla_globosa_v1_NODE_1379_length_2620_cov_34.296686.p4 type:complete len:133 gc:universal NODE_1379_length_2620_cov_34.296686:1372-1770(+)